MDGYNDGHRNANADGAAQVMVLLDAPFSTQTDASGRSSFPYVAPGKHVINVNTRSVSNVSIAATKP